MKIHPVRAEFFQVDRETDRQTDMTKLTVAFSVSQTHLKLDLKKIWCEGID